MNKINEGVPLDMAADAASDPRLLAGQLGREIASPLASALDRVITLTTTGKIRRTSLSALRDEIEQALRAGTAAQELCQLMHQSARQRPDRIDLGAALRQTLVQMRGPHAADEVRVLGSLAAPLATTDPTLAGRLMTAVAQWALYRGSSAAQWTVEAGRLQTEARITCVVRLRSDERGDDGRTTMDWRLVETLSEALGTRLLRRDDAGLASLVIEFPRTAAQHAIEGMLVEELDPDEAAALYAKTVAGTSLLIVAGRQETREIVQQAVKPLGLISDFARSVEEARDFCDSGLPHAIVYEPTVRGVPFEPLRIKLMAQAPSIAMVEIHDEERNENILNEIRPRPRAKRKSLMQDLPPLLMNELTRSLQP